MATLVAIRHNPTIKAFYVHLKSKGKESKVAILLLPRIKTVGDPLLLPTQENPFGLSDGSFGFVLRSVVRNRKYRWASRRDSCAIRAFHLSLIYPLASLRIFRSISGIGFQPVALKMTGWKPIPRQKSDTY